MGIENKLFGKVEAQGDREVDPAEIMKNFEKQDTEIFLFCTNCEAIYELNKQDLEVLEIKIPEKKEKTDYLESRSCENCSKGKKDIVLKKINLH